MLFIMSGTLCWSALPCSVCTIGTLPCLSLLETPCSCSCGSMTLWGGTLHHGLYYVLGVSLLMLLMMHQPHLYQAWRLDHYCPNKNKYSSEAIVLPDSRL